MRRLEREPEYNDFVASEEYETSAPASFGLPELPVLYIKSQISPSTSVWVASNGVSIWDGQAGSVYDLESPQVANGSLICPDKVFNIDSLESAHQLKEAIARCARLFGSASATDSVELAVQTECETGDADDLGDAQLVQSIGEGTTSRNGPAMAQKRRRSS